MKNEFTLSQRRLEDIARNYTHSVGLSVSNNFPGKNYHTEFEKDNRDLSTSLKGSVKEIIAPKSRIKEFFEMHDEKDIASLYFNIDEDRQLLQPKIVVHDRIFLNDKTQRQINDLHESFYYGLVSQPKYVYDMPIV